ncbi:MAG: DNA-binding protein Alba [Thaumarchaeota archaeon]|nr:DNA-binding protein Alba [Nitrososphaerota archaeon]
MSAKSSMKKQTRSKDDDKSDTPSDEAPSLMGMPQNHIYVGKKPVMNYAMSALIQLSQLGEVVIKARGMAISRAVDVAEIVTKRLGNGTFLVKNINIATEQVKSTETGEMRNISSIEILVGK